MQTTLWATLTANGNYARGTVAHPPKPEALADFGREAKAHGCFIAGRRTFEEFGRQAARRPPAEAPGEDPMAGVTIVVPWLQPLPASPLLTPVFGLSWVMPRRSELLP